MMGDALQQVYDKVYTGKIREITRRTGLDQVLSGPYWKFVYLLSTDEQKHTIANQEAAFRVDTFTEFMRFNHLAGERPIIEDVLESLNPDDVFYDIGANVGTYTCFATSKLNPESVVAFEPEPKNTTRLRENLTLNDVEAKIVEVALSNTNGTTDLALTGKETGEGKHSIATDDDAQTIEVETAKGDSIVDQRELPAPTVVKIDVEGAELSVLRGLRETLRENCRLMYVEVHPEKISGFDAQPSEVRTFLTEVGFEVTEMAQRGNEVFLRASK